ncbi:hypothetical protein UPYG_G00245080 [Umbra pygmaea]|uniref:AIG1-type G domain-containing protein n=1 Tax=Umbra pygmaea TaxID=75934 RepID=A0ABD0X6M7_UMBPY
MATRKSYRSSTLQQIISKSTLIHEGPTKIYQLLPKKQTLDDRIEKESKLKKWTIGYRDPSKDNRTVLMVGMNGAGKTTLINAIVNYVMGVEWEDKVWLEIVGQGKRRLSQCQTSEVTVYEIFGFEGGRVPYSLTIINTPGYEDNQGFQEVSDTIQDLFINPDGIDRIDAVGLVIKASESRLSYRLKQIFDTIIDFFGKDMEKKSVALFTHSDVGTAPSAIEAVTAADINFAKDRNNQPVYFLFNNCQALATSSEEETNMKVAWDTSMKGMEEFLEFLGRQTLQDLKMPAKVLTEHTHPERHNNSGNCLNENLVSKRPIGTTITRGGVASTSENQQKPMPMTVPPVTLPKPKNVKRVLSILNMKHNDVPGKTMDGASSVKQSMSGPAPFSTKMKSSFSEDDVKPTYVPDTQRTRSEAASQLSTPCVQQPGLTTTSQITSARTGSQLSTPPVQPPGLTTTSQITSARTGSPGKTGTSTNLDDIIMKSKLIHTGPPKRYQLAPKKKCLDGRSEEESKLKRWSIGEKDPSKVNRTLLLVGETGAGKSTMINAMINYVMGVEREDKIWFEIIEEGKRSQAESQTSEVIVYDIFGFEGRRVPYSLTIIDTPGYGDTRGIQEDRLITEMLHDLFRSPEGIHQIDAVGFVVKASTNRLSDRQRYIFEAVLSLFGKDMENQIIAFISHSDGGPATNALEALKNANIKCAKDKDNQPVHFLFNNRQTEIVTNRKQERAMNSAWDTTTDGMDEFSEFLGKISPQKLKMTVEVLTKRVKLEACVNNIQDRIEMIEGKQALLKKTHDELWKHKKEIEENKNFVITVTETYKQRVTIEERPNKAVCCTVCEENCHYPGCTIAKDPYWCEVIKNGYCTSCTGRCPASTHVRENWRYVLRTEQITRTHDDLKKKYVENMRAAGEKSDLIACLQKELDKAVRDKARLVDESYQCVVKLEEIALRCNSLSTHVHLDFLIDKLKEKRDIEKAGKLEKMKCSAGETIKKGLGYVKTALGYFLPRKS